MGYSAIAGFTALLKRAASAVPVCNAGYVAIPGFAALLKGAGYGASMCAATRKASFEPRRQREYAKEAKEKGKENKSKGNKDMIIRG